MKFCCAPKSPLHRPSRGRSRNPRSCRVPALPPALAFRAFLPLSLPPMKSSPLLLSCPAPPECHGMSAAHRHGFLLVSSGTPFLLAGFSPSTRLGPPFVVWSWSRFLSGDQLAGKCLLVVIPSSSLALLLFTLSLPLADPWNCERGECEER